MSCSDPKTEGDKRPVHVQSNGTSGPQSYCAEDYLPGGQKYQEALAEFRRNGSPRQGSSVQQWLGDWIRKWQITTVTSPNLVSGHMTRLQFSQDVNILEASQISKDRWDDFEEALHLS